MMPVRLESAAPWSRVKHSTTEPLCSLLLSVVDTDKSILNDQIIVVILNIGNDCVYFIFLGNGY